MRPAVEIAAKDVDALTAELYVLSAARQDGDARLFFLACGHTNAVSFVATFDAGSRVPRLFALKSVCVKNAMCDL